MARVVMSGKAVDELLRSAEVRADLERRGKAVRDAAGPGYELQMWQGRRRWRATVRAESPEARAREATQRSLLQALAAGR